MKSNTGILVRSKPTHQPIRTVTEHLAENLNKTTLLTLGDHAKGMRHFHRFLLLSFLLFLMKKDLKISFLQSPIILSQGCWNSCWKGRNEAGKLT